MRSTPPSGAAGRGALPSAPRREDLVTGSAGPRRSRSRVDDPTYAMKTFLVLRGVDSFRPEGARSLPGTSSPW